MSATFKIGRDDPAYAVASEFVVGNDLSHQLQIVKERKFTGALEISSANHQWVLYFSLGDLYWADGGEHPQRRWRRLLYQYCAHNLPSTTLTDDRERLFCLARWMQEGKLTQGTFYGLVRSAAGEVLFDLLQQKFYCEFFHFNELPLVKYPVLTRLPVVQLLERMKTLWDQWQVAKLSHVSPHAAVSLAIPLGTNQNCDIDRQFHLKLARMIDGDKTIADLVLLWEKERSFAVVEDPVVTVKWIVTLVEDGWLRLHPVVDLPSHFSLHSLGELLKIKSSHPRRQYFLEQQATALTPVPFSLLMQAVGTTTAIAMTGFVLAFVASSLPRILQLERSALPIVSSSTNLPIVVSGDRERFSFFRNTDFQAQMQSYSLEVTYFERNTSSASGQIDLSEVRLSQFLRERISGKIVGIVTDLRQDDPIVLVASERLLMQPDLVKKIVKAYYLNFSHLVDTATVFEWMRSGKLQYQIDALESKLDRQHTSVSATKRHEFYDFQYIAAVVRDTTMPFQTLWAEYPQLAEVLAKKYTSTLFGQQ